jgi:hypothetical protein
MSETKKNKLKNKESPQGTPDKRTAAIVTIS